MTVGRYTKTIITVIAVGLWAFAHSAAAKEECFTPTPKPGYPFYGKVISEGDACNCPAGTEKLHLHVPSGDFSNGAAWCDLGMTNCTWAYECRPNASGAVQHQSAEGSASGCSSVALGQAKQCISVEKTRDLGRAGYYLTASCPGTYYAAVGTYDENNLCRREVASREWLEFRVA